MEEGRRSLTPTSNNRRTSIAFAADPPRRTSVQLSKAAAPARREVAQGPLSAGLPPTNNSELLPRGRTRQRSLSSPPPPPSFIKRVSFDTFDNRDASDFSLTLKSKHKDYAYSRQSRTFLCGTDQNVYSTTALEWLMEELVDDGDEIVCLRVLEKDSKIMSDHSVQERLYRREAEKLLQEIISKNEEDKAISIILEYSVGKVHDSIQRMINIYEPVMLIVGTRGRSLGGIQGLLPGSVSKYCLQHSPVPVIVVRPSTKREKKKKKRQEDPARRTYLDIMNKSSSELSTINMLNSANSSMILNTGSGTSTPELLPSNVKPIAPTAVRPSSISFSLPASGLSRGNSGLSPQAQNDSSSAIPSSGSPQEDENEHGLEESASAQAEEEEEQGREQGDTGKIATSDAPSERDELASSTKPKDSNEPPDAAGEVP